MRYLKSREEINTWHKLKYFALLFIIAILALFILPKYKEYNALSKISGQLVFLAEKNKETNLYVLNMPGRKVLTLAKHLNEWPGPCWAADKKRIIFGSKRNTPQNLWIIGADGTQLENLTPNAEVIEDNVSCRPNANQIVYATYPLRTLVVLDLDTKIQKTIFKNSSQFVGFPAWSPDGQHIAFITGSGESGAPQQLYSIDPDGNNLQLLAEDAVMFSAPLWSPKSDRLAYRAVEKIGTSLRFIKLDDRSIKNLLSRNPNAPENFTWSPNENSIAYNEMGSYANQGVAIFKFDQNETTVLVEGMTKHIAWPQDDVLSFAAYGAPTRFQPWMCFWNCGYSIFLAFNKGNKIYPITDVFDDIYSSSWQPH